MPSAQDEERKEIEELGGYLPENGELSKQTGYYYSNPRYAELTKEGIRSFVYDEKKGEIKKETLLWTWEEFKILHVYKDEHHELVFDFKYNGNRYRNLGFTEMRDRIAELSLLSSGGRQVFGPLVQLYLTKKELEIKKIHNKCGFTKKGWILPHEKKIKASVEIHAVFQERLKKLGDISLKDDFLERFTAFIDAITVDHRDILLAYGMVAPFFYVLKDYTDLTPYLALYSDKNTTGKSEAADLISYFFWGHTPVLGTTEWNSVSRARDYLSSCTFPVVIDEASTLKDKIVDLVKSTATSQMSGQAKNTDQSFKLYREYQSSIIYTFNTAPGFFDDAPYLSRGLILELWRELTKGEKEQYKKAKEHLERGEIGKYIVEKMRGYTKQDLIKKLKEIKSVDGLSIRQQEIYNLIHLGKILFKEVFGMELDLSELPNQLLDTARFGSDDIFVMVQAQFKGGEKWIQSEVTFHDDHYFYDANNLADLKRRCGKDIAGVRELREILIKRWKVSEYKPVCVNGITRRGILIPKNHQTVELHELEEQYGEIPEIKRNWKEDVEIDLDNLKWKEKR